MRVANLLAGVLMAWWAAASAAGAPVDAVERLRAAESADQRLSYRATFKVSTGGSSGTAVSQATLIHKPGFSRWEYEAPASGGLVIIEKGESVIRLDSKRRIATVTHAQRKPAISELLVKNYAIAFEKSEEVAGRAADVLAIRHRQSQWLGKRVWVDRETGLILRSEEYDHAGGIRAQTMCQSLEWNPSMEDGLFQVPAGWQQVVAEEQNPLSGGREALSKALGFTVREPASIPAGFVLEGLSLYRCPCGASAAHWRYVDGLQSFSLFEKTTRCGAPGRARGGQGSCPCERVAGIPGKMWVKSGQVLTYVAVGDLPEDEWEKMAAGFE